MENLETQVEMSNVNSVLEESEMSGRTESMLNKANKSIFKSVSFSFLEDDKLRMSEDAGESFKTNNSKEHLLKKVHTNIESSNDTNPSKQSNNLSLNILYSHLENSSRLTDTDNSIEHYKETYHELDGQHERFDDVTSSTEIIPRCIPPWARTMHTKYGVSPSSSYVKDHKSRDEVNVNEKIRQLMNKYSDLMLVKRVESKKKVIVEQGKKYDDIDTITSRAMHTRYYVAPLIKDGNEKREEKNDNQASKYIDYSSIHSDNISLTKKTSKTQAKKEVQGIVHPDMKKTFANNYGLTETKDHSKCQKLTLRNIRDYVNAQSMSLDQRKLHEIIKIETVPSKNNGMKERGFSKYIINVPQNKSTDLATVNVIKIKEKRKLRVESIEDVCERTTELHYSKVAPQTQKVQLSKLSNNDKIDLKIGKNVKSPTETRTFQVTSNKTTPHKGTLAGAENDTDKVLLLQYENKSAKDKSKDDKQSKYTTKLLGVRRPASDKSGGMYLYEAEAFGEKQTERTTKVEGVYPTLREKLNSIFDELRGLTPKKDILPDTVSSDVLIKPHKSDHSSQGPLQPIGTDAVSIQAMPDVKSVEIQVRESQILSPGFIAPHPSPRSEYIPDQIVETDERLGETSKYLLAYTETQLESGHENISEKELFNDEKNKTKQFDKGEETSELKKEQLRRSTDFDRHEEKRLSEQSLEEQTKLRTDDKIIVDEVDNELVKEDITSDKLLTFDGKREVESSPIQGRLDEGKMAVAYEGKSIEAVEVADIGDELGISKDLPTHRDLVIHVKKADKSSVEEFEHTMSTSKNQQFDDDKVQVRSESPSKMVVTPYKEEQVDKHYKTEKSQEAIVKTLKGSHDSSLIGTEKTNHTSAIQIDDDIRSYNLDGFRDTKLNFKSPSKFIQEKNSIRKRLNWSDDTLYLEKHLCPQLVRGLAETALRRPADPVEFLAHWIYKDYQNREQSEIDTVHQEHRQLERAMCDVQRPSTLVPKKFNSKKYPVKQLPSNNSKNENSTLESFKGGAIENEIAQEA